MIIELGSRKVPIRPKARRGVYRSGGLGLSAEPNRTMEGRKYARRTASKDCLLMDLPGYGPFVSDDD